MPRIVFIFPSIGHKPGKAYVRSWQMQPLAIAQLSALTPPEWERIFYDDRMETIPEDTQADLCAISIETYTARRGYQIAAEFRRRNIPVVFGGFHATACPEEVLKFGDAVCVGEAENIWSEILKDTISGRLHGIYRSPRAGTFPDIAPDRTIFSGKKYMKLELIETGRGCLHSCEFCSITAFHEHQYRRRPVDDIVDELRSLQSKSVFFVDDNLTADRAGLRELCNKIAPLGLNWISQASIDIARDEELPKLLARSGCAGLLIGFESLNQNRLNEMNKQTNRTENYKIALARLHKAHIPVYGTFILGYPGDTQMTVDKAVAFAVSQRMFLAAFNPLIPFPGTKLYRKAQLDGRLAVGQWWLDPDFCFGQTPLDRPSQPCMQISSNCINARRTFYSWSNIARRFTNFSANSRSLQQAVIYWLLNAMLRREIKEKSGIPLGLEPNTVTDRNKNQLPAYRDIEILKNKKLASLQRELE